MTDIERWTLRFVRYVVAESGSSHMNAVVRGPAVPWHGADVEVVPAEQLEGAVERIDAIAARMDEATSHDPSDHTGTRAWAAEIRSAVRGHV